MLKGFLDLNIVSIDDSFKRGGHWRHCYLFNHDDDDDERSFIYNKYSFNYRSNMRKVMCLTE